MICSGKSRPAATSRAIRRVASTAAAAVAALEGSQDFLADWRERFRARRDLCVAALNAIPGVRCAMPKGAFYAFPNVSGLFGRRGEGGVLRGSADVCAFLLDAQGVLHFITLDWPVSDLPISEGS